MRLAIWDWVSSFNAASGICSLQQQAKQFHTRFSVVSMPQAAYVHCNFVVKDTRNIILSCFNAASGICSLQPLLNDEDMIEYLKFQCRKRHMFVATERLRKHIRSQIEFQCRKRHMFVATERVDFYMDYSTMFQCRKRHMFVATEREIEDNDSEWGFNAASGICSLQLKEVQCEQPIEFEFQCRKRHMFVATSSRV